MRIRRALPLALAVAFAPFWGCATVVNGNSQTIHVETDPPGATVSVGGERHTSPVDLVIPRKSKDVEIVIEKEGWITKRIPLLRKLSATTWWNLTWIPVGAGIGAVTYSTGSGWFQPSQAETAGAAAVAGALVAGTGFLIDGASGANWRFEPPAVIVKLEPASPPLSAAAPAPTP